MKRWKPSCGVGAATDATPSASRFAVFLKAKVGLVKQPSGVL